MTIHSLNACIALGHIYTALYQKSWDIQLSPIIPVCLYHLFTSHYLMFPRLYQLSLSMQGIGWPTCVVNDATMKENNIK